MLNIVVRTLCNPAPSMATNCVRRHVKPRRDHRDVPLKLRDGKIPSSPSVRLVAQQYDRVQNTPSTKYAVVSQKQIAYLKLELFHGRRDTGGIAACLVVNTGGVAACLVVNTGGVAGFDGVCACLSQRRRRLSAREA